MRGSTEALENKVRTYLKNEIPFPPNTSPDWKTCRPTRELPSGLHVAAALQSGQHGGQAIFLLHLHLVLVVLVDDVAEGPGGGPLHDLLVAAEQNQELVDAVQAAELQGQNRDAGLELLVPSTCSQSDQNPQHVGRHQPDGAHNRTRSI